MLPAYSKTHDRLLICPSILSADFLALGRDVERVADDADVIHVDVMDGHFVPNLSYGIPIVETLARSCDLPLDVHLMIDNPMDHIDAFSRAGADSIVVHAEACPHLHRAMQHIHQSGCTAGVALNPGTPLTVLDEIIPFVDMILLMTVNPGFGGQTFIDGMTDKIRRLRKMLNERDCPVHIQIDGGINPGNIKENVAAGANLVVVGSAVFGQDDPAEAIRNLRKCAQS
jgi:ribulose-phosphate 3-epimerase